MTRAEILALPADRELDALVASKVMGWREVCEEEIVGSKVTYYDWTGIHAVSGMRFRLPDYSANIAAAWQVVEKLDMGWLLCDERDGEDVVCRFLKPGMFPFEPQASADTVSLAICRAALLATLNPD